eukprot:TRINITY_DN15900_c0_g1_i1.p1 TRINITY_DN15900_c0_g1~~TRINITY_DN15900_c0_g1_i1.p1  ORF type:complete len:405 (+),score=61.08 TRINITY_DN15900_c0_g1_i1:47-1216(+)
MPNFVCGNCQHKFEDENGLTYCPMCCEICEPIKEAPKPTPPSARPKPTNQVANGVTAPAFRAPPPRPVATRKLDPEPAEADFVGESSPADDFDAYVPEPVAAPVPEAPKLPPCRADDLRIPTKPPAALALLAPASRLSTLPRLNVADLRQKPQPKRPLSAPADAASSPKRARTDMPTVPDIARFVSVWATIKPHHAVLLIGEGNMSFAHALCNRIGTGRGVCATDVEMHHELQAPSGCDIAVASLLRMGACLNCATDVTKLSTSSPWKDRAGTFDFMSWAFPHTRTPNKDKKSVPEHRWLLRAFIDEAAVLLKPGGKALITVKEGYPYNSWDVAGLKSEAVGYVSMEPFLPKDFPEYRHVTTVGAPIMQITPATTHIFTRLEKPATIAD